MKNPLHLLLTIGLFVQGCGTYDYKELIKQGAPGLPGSSGDSQAIQFRRFYSDTFVCASGSGVIIESYHYAVFEMDKTIDSATVICDGLNGKDGLIGEAGPQGIEGDKGDTGATGATAPTNPYDVVQIIDPCGDAPGIYDEVFLKMQNGILIASFSDNANGNNTRLSLLVNGSYVTTDGSNCHVTVSNGSVTW